eukprot:6397474-Amphidinium_carterae.1
MGVCSSCMHWSSCDSIVGMERHFKPGPSIVQSNGWQVASYGSTVFVHDLCRDPPLRSDDVSKL